MCCGALGIIIIIIIIIIDVEYIYGFVGWGGLQAKSMTSQRNRAVRR